MFAEFRAEVTESGDIETGLGKADSEPYHEGLAVEGHCLGEVTRFGTQVPSC